MSDQWYVARTKSAIVWDVAIAQLERQHFTARVPIVRSQSYLGGRKTIVKTPLFGSYMFILFDIETTRWRAINNSVGVVHLLPERLEIPLPVPRGFVEGLQNRPTVQKVEELGTHFLHHGIVRVLTGMFQNRFARVLSSTRT
jgi:transcription antitermination factor NusG